MLVVAIDGHGAAGKSTIAAAVCAATGAALVHTDDFFRPRAALPGGVSGPPPGQEPLAGYYDWRRLRAQALEPLRARRRAKFRRFDWDRGTGLDGLVTVEPGRPDPGRGRVLRLASARRPGGPGGLCRRARGERLRRLRGRVTPEEWDADWLIAEQAYFDLIRPPASFDLTVSGAGRPAGEFRVAAR